MKNNDRYRKFVNIHISYQHKDLLNKFSRIYTVLVVLIIMATQSLYAQFTKLYDFQVDENTNTCNKPTLYKFNLR